MAHVTVRMQDIAGTNIIHVRMRYGIQAVDSDPTTAEILLVLERGGY